MTMGATMKGGARAVRCAAGVLLAMLLLGLSTAKGEEGDAFLQGNQYYERGQYDSAIMVYEALLASGQYNAEVYYNLGNAYYRAGQYPRAILNYERALKVSPRHEDARANLVLARTYVKDRLSVPEEWPIVRWAKGIPLWFTEVGWGWIGGVSITLLAVVALLFRFYVGRRWWVLVGAGGLLLLAVGLMSFFFSAHHHALMNRPESAIVMQSVVSVKSSPDAESKDLFLLHAGTKVKLRERIGEWWEVEIPDGARGWVEAKTIEGI